MNDYRSQLAGSTIRYKSGRVMVIQYVLVDLPSRFEKRGRRFKPAWTIGFPQVHQGGRSRVKAGVRRAHRTRPPGEVDVSELSEILRTSN